MRAWVVAGVVAFAAVGGARAEVLTVEDAVQRALTANGQVRVARERQEGAAAQVNAVRGQMLPSGAVQEEFQHYDRDYAVAFGPSSLTLHEQNTNSFVIAGKQPLLGLVRLSQEYGAAAASEKAATAQVESTAQGVREAVETGYLRLFEARAAMQIAQSSQEQLTEQLAVQEARVAAGAGTTADVLRVKVARANVRQQELQAKVQEAASRTQLLTLLDLGLDAKVEFAEPTSLEEAAALPAPAVDAATAQALAQRPDLAVAARQAEGAEASSRARLAALLPEVDLEGAYVEVKGQSALAPQYQKYVGLKASWPFWTWGAQWYAHQAAAHQATAAKLASDEAQRQVRGEVAVRLDQLASATAAVEVAKTALESAEEAYRVTAEVVKAGSGTTTDLLDAQSALTQSKLNLVRSKYAQAMARVQLKRALGG